MSWFTDARDQVYKDTGVDQYLSGNPQAIAGAVEGIGRAVGDTVKGSGSPAPSPAAVSTPVAKAAALVKDNQGTLLLVAAGLALVLIMRGRK
jgi:hypothetical protein